MPHGGSSRGAALRVALVVACALALSAAGRAAPAASASQPELCRDLTRDRGERQARAALLMAALTRTEQKEQADQEIRVLEAMDAGPSDPSYRDAQRRFERASRELSEICRCLGKARSELGDACRGS